MTDREELLSAVRRSVESYCAACHNFAFDPTAPAIRLHEPTFGAEEIMAALECLLETRITLGDRVKDFERAFAGRMGLAHAVMSNSGSSANLLAVAALTNAATEGRLGPGDEIVVPALSWSTTVWPLIQYGLVPVLVDIDPVTLNMDPNELERAIGPKTRGVVLVHVYGNPCEMDAIREICRRRSLVLIEDCCEALGAAWQGTPVGALGHVGTFSFYFSHHITTLEGGICVTADDALAERMRILRAHGWVREVENPEPYTQRHPEIDPRFLFVDLGYNLRPTEPQAAFGAVQLGKLDAFVEKRRTNAAALLDALAPYQEVLTLQRETSGGRHSWFGFPVTVRETAPFTARMLRDFLERANIETRPLICGNIAKQPGLQNHSHRIVGDLRHATAAMRAGFAIGNHQAMDEAAVRYVAERFAEFMHEAGVT